jgi:hypothetical protein
VAVTAIEWAGLCTERAKECSVCDILLQNVPCIVQLVSVFVCFVLGLGNLLPGNISKLFITLTSTSRFIFITRMNIF